MIGFLQGREIPSRATSPTNYWTQKPRWPRTIISLISSLRRTLCAVHDSRCLEMRFTTAVVRKARKQVSRDGSERRTVDRPVVWVLPFRIRIPIEFTLPLPRSRNRALWFDPVSDVTSRSLDKLNPVPKQGWHYWIYSSFLCFAFPVFRTFRSSYSPLETGFMNSN